MYIYTLGVYNYTLCNLHKNQGFPGKMFVQLAY